MSKQDLPLKLTRPRLHAGRVIVDALFWPALLLVIWGELAPPDVEGAIGVNDKLLHFIAYFGLAAMAAAGLKTRLSAVKAVLALIVFGGVLEIVQGLVGRDMSVFDGLANAVGAVTGGVLARLVIEPLRQRIADERT